MTLGRISGLTAWAAIGAAWALPPNPAIEAAPAIEVPAPSREAEAPVAKPGPQRYAAGFAPVMDEADQWAVAHLSFPELPPPEFDGPAKTAIWVTDIPSERELREACGWAERKPGEGHLVGCARRMTGGEWSVFLGREVTMRAYGLTKNIVIRHEVGHVNGWGADHPGAWPAVAKPVVAQVEATPLPRARPVFGPSREVASARTRRIDDRPADVAALRLGGPLGGLLDLLGVQPGRPYFFS